MGDEVKRLRNVVALCKLETTEGVDAVPAAATDAFPFEIDAMSIGSPFTTEESNEATPTMIAGAPLIIGQAVPVSIRMRLKGAGVGQTYSASIKPPSHTLLACCGWRGVFQAGVAATALAAGTVSSATLATPYVATANQYRGMPLVMSGIAAGSRPLITDYTAGRVATLADLYGTALAATSSAQILPNWTYAKTSPASAAERAADEPSGTIYAYEDGILYKLFAFRGAPKFSAASAKAGFLDIQGMAIWGGQSDVDVPTNAVIANHAAPVLAMQAAISAAFVVNRLQLPISSFTYDPANQIDSYEDPNTPIGYGGGILGGRAPLLTCDPLKTRLSVRNHLSALETGAGPFVGGIRAGQQSGNRWSLTLPQLVPATVEMGTRGNARSESLGFRALSPGRDAAGRDGDAILCFD